MRKGHRLAQDQFLALGERHGFKTRRSFTSAFPSDGVWLTRSTHGDAVGGLPVVALEVVVSESPKTILGSIAVLERIAPSLGVLLVHEDEIARRLVRDGRSREEVSRYLEHTQARVDMHIATSRHRIERWSSQYLTKLYNNSMAA
ncbi:hypothetical protein [Blastococcus sp. SYSU DS0617]